MQNEKLKKLDQFYFIEGFFFFLRKIIKNYEAKILCIITLFDSLKLLFNKTKWWDSFSKEIILRSTIFNKTEQTDMLQVE